MPVLRGAIAGIKVNQPHDNKAYIEGRVASIDLEIRETRLSNHFDLNNFGKQSGYPFQVDSVSFSQNRLSDYLVS